MGERAEVLKTQISSGHRGVYMASMWGEGHAHYPGRSVYLSRKGLGKPEGRPKDRQKSAELIVACKGEGANM